MTYLIGDQSVTLDGGTLTEAEERLIRAHPEIFQICLNSSARQYLLTVKKIVHLFTDIITIYSTLLSKIPNYDDIRAMASKTRVSLTRIETDLNSVFGPHLDVGSDGWEAKNYEADVKKLAFSVLKACADALEHMYKTLSCIDVFFASFDNLKKLLVPGLLTHTHMVQKSVAGAMSFFRLPTIVNQIAMLEVMTPTVVKQLAKIDTITCGLERETRLLEMVFSAINPNLQQYTAILLGKAILKQDVSSNECEIVVRREVCYKAAEHVVSIPLSGSPKSQRYMYNFTRHVFFFFSAVLVVFVAVAYRLYNVIFG